MRRNIAVLPFVVFFLLTFPGFNGNVMADGNQSENSFQGETVSEFMIDGFRSAKFGMDEAAIRNAIARDFPSKADKVHSEVHMIQKTKVFSIFVEDLLPDAGVAMISYVTGYKTQKLIHVGVTWNGKEQEIGSAAIILRDYFSALSLPRDKVASNLSLPNGSMLVFRGMDSRGRMISVLLQKVIPQDGESKAENGSLTRMELYYADNPEHPDVFMIRPGEF